jgi:acyl-CoA synthetase (NDP forming)
MQRELQPLLAPRSVAVVGASDDAAKWGYGVARGVLRGAGRRRVHFVNARAPEVQGQRTVPSLRDLDEPVDCAVLVVPAGAFEEVVEDGLARGVRAFVGITIGFAETGDDGRALEARVAARVRESGAVLLGPNCMGVWSGHEGFDAAWLDYGQAAGAVAIVSQSGGLGVEFTSYGMKMALGLSHFVSIGNQADLTAGDLVTHLAGDDRVRAIGVYCEDFRDGRGFLRAVAAARAASKPVIVLSPTGEPAGRAALSHTGSLVSSQRVVEAALRDAGALRVATPEELMEMAQGLLMPARPRGRRVAVVSDGGGIAVIAAGVLAADGFTIPELSGPLQATLRRLRPGAASTRNPIDLTAVLDDLMTYPRVLDALFASGEVDAAIVGGSFGTITHEDPAREDEAAAAGAMAAAGHPVAAAVQWPGEPPWQALRDGGVPAFRRVGSACRALAAATAFELAEPRRTPAWPEPATPVADTGYTAARRLLADAGVPFAAAREVRDADAAIAAAERLGYPVVLKALATGHKSDAGGVVLGLRTAEELAAAFADVTARLAPPACSVERMVTGPVAELVCGVTWDPRFGPVAMVGSGGTAVELLDDVVLALAPLDPDEAAALVRRLRTFPLLDGFRGRPRLALDRAAAAIAALTQVAARHPELAEVEVNPLLVGPDFALAVDARTIPV